MLKTENENLDPTLRGEGSTVDRSEDTRRVGLNKGRSTTRAVNPREGRRT